MKSMMAIPREQGLSVAKFRSTYLKREQPVVLVGAAREWPAFDRWTPECLQTTSPADPIHINRAARGEHFDYADNPIVEKENGSWQAFVNSVFNPGPNEAQWYLGQAPLRVFPELARDICTPEWLPGTPGMVCLWVGSKGNVTRAHYDTEDNILVQLRGRKRVVLFPSSQHGWLYPRSIFAEQPNFARVDINAPDLTMFPKFSGATAWEGILEPGDMLYLPIYWWHEVYSLDAGISVNFWWPTRPGQAMRVPGVRYWPKMARGGYLHHHLATVAKQALRGTFHRGANVDQVPSHGV